MRLANPGRGDPAAHALTNETRCSPKLGQQIASSRGEQRAPIARAARMICSTTALLSIESKRAALSASNDRPSRPRPTSTAAHHKQKYAKARCALPPDEESAPAA